MKKLLLVLVVLVGNASTMHAMDPLHVMHRQMHPVKSGPNKEMMSHLIDASPKNKNVPQPLSAMHKIAQAGKELAGDAFEIYSWYYLCYMYGILVHELGHGIVGTVITHEPFKLCLGDRNAPALFDSKFLRIALKGLRRPLEGGEAAAVVFDDELSMSDHEFLVACVAGPLCGTLQNLAHLRKIAQQTPSYISHNTHEQRMFWKNIIKGFCGVSLLFNQLANLTPLANDGKMIFDVLNAGQETRDFGIAVGRNLVALKRASLMLGGAVLGGYIIKRLADLKNSLTDPEIHDYAQNNRARRSAIADVD